MFDDCIPVLMPRVDIPDRGTARVRLESDMDSIPGAEDSLNIVDAFQNSPGSPVLQISVQRTLVAIFRRAP